MHRTLVLLVLLVPGCLGSEDENDGENALADTGADIAADEDSLDEPAAPVEIAEPEELSGVLSNTALCRGTTSPFSTGPRCCPGDTVLRPSHGACYRFKNLSQHRDIFGIYRSDTDRPNAIPVDNDTLQICAVYLFDNGEGTAWPHGPYGHVYVDRFDASERLLASPDGAAGRRLEGAKFVRGPHPTHGRNEEWLADEFQRYWAFGLWKWDRRQALVIRFWESDGSEDGNWLGRRNDVLGMELVRRGETLGAGRWYALHSYTNQHPRQRTGRITGWVHLKTGGACPQ